MVTICTSCFDNQLLCIYKFCVILGLNFIFLNGINRLIFVMVKCDLFEVRTEF
jgi:hypothetical protein